MVRAKLKRLIIEARGFDFRSRTMFCVWSPSWNAKITIEGRYEYKITDIKSEIIRYEKAINRGELACNVKNQKYMAALYKELKRLGGAA
ncbi:hypothetical protein [Campylobacter concisus]|nr:hypothetical protein [Campylobacter concisus]